jgi:hypothetical protein
MRTLAVADALSEYLWHVKLHLRHWERTMSAHFSADVRTLFADLGIEVENADRATGLVIDRFEQWGDGAPAAGAIRATICRVDVLEAA